MRRVRYAVGMSLDGYTADGRGRTSWLVSDPAVRSRWWEGRGIRFTSQGMLYNVSGTRAVEVQLRDGTRFRLGTDEPERLGDAIRAELGEPAAG
jgi:hypothetical protein